MASSMIDSSSLLVIITTGREGCERLILLSVASPSMPGICSSRNTISNTRSLMSVTASLPFVTGTISNPLFSRKIMCGLSWSISSSAQRIRFDIAWGLKVWNYDLTNITCFWVKCDRFGNLFLCPENCRNIDLRHGSQIGRKVLWWHLVEVRKQRPKIPDR